MAANFPNLPVLNKVFANNSRIAPNATSNNTLVEHKNFDMAHPQKLDPGTLNNLLGQLDFNNPNQNTNGVIKGKTQDGGTFMLTPGVLKMKKGHNNGGYTPSQPPAYGDYGNTTTPPANTNYMA